MKVEKIIKITITVGIPEPLEGGLGFAIYTRVKNTIELVTVIPAYFGIRDARLIAVNEEQKRKWESWDLIAIPVSLK